ncbi:Uu.00g132850.m01.CDS01 [Anthostomella pinea]|uniref:Uu.00g132850.m01.CDS01 n=1 Tax=Anthostomella pinea TaxID=933095 RepID=A0AAI8YMW2_9PEZI|nr:Uu.00g132850.m01.CDS01 [Anthostomella pinea]
MAASNPVIIIIHGGWHLPQHYAKLSNGLEGAGFEVHMPQLPSMNGAMPPTADLASDTEFIKAYVEKLLDAGKTVIAITHSYGGQGLKGAVAHLIYMTAFALPEGMSMIDQVVHMGHKELIPLAFDYRENGTVADRDPRGRLVGAWHDDAEADAYVAALGIWGAKPMQQPVERCAWREIPVTYIETSQDGEVPLVYQEDMVARMRAEGVEVKTATLETGHCPNFTMPGEVVKVVEGVASAISGAA